MTDTANVVFFGSPPFAVRSLSALLESGRHVPLVVTQPDRPAGRGRNLTPPAVKRFCDENRIPVLQPLKMKDPAFHESLRAANSDLFVVAAYGRILPGAVLEIPELTLNVHASLLPRWRGAAPIQRAIMAGDKLTGVSIMRLVEELDAGDFLLQRETAIDGDETAGELENRLADLGAETLLMALEQLRTGKGRFQPQDVSRVTFCPPIEAAEGRIQWSRPVREIHDRVRGLNPWPGAFTMAGSQRIKIHRTRPNGSSGPVGGPGSVRREGAKLLVACEGGWLEILELQREGKARQNASVFLAGYRLSDDTKWS